MITADVYAERISVAANSQVADAVLVTPGASLRYLTGYDALPLERLTCLVLHGERRALVVPLLEEPAARASGADALGLEIVTWDETTDPIALVASWLSGAAQIAVDDAMPAAKVLGFRDALPSVELTLAGPIIDDLRIRKSPAELNALREAGRAIDSVHARMGEWLRARRTEREVGRDIADAIIAAGHDRVDFVIVASGPNGASPHHEVSDRVIEAGDAVVVDIGGTMPSGYCSDCTRTYSVGQPADDFTTAYASLQTAQAAQVAAARVGLSAHDLDAVGRDILVEAGLGDAFIHRTGHGIGLSTHEEPYIVAGNTLPLEEGMAFSIEPGFYLAGLWGARIEDIVVLGPDGAESVNLTTHDLVIL